jgi:hypothetical protein
MSRTRKKPRAGLDEDRFVRDVLDGQLAPAELADKHGMSLPQIDAVLAGRKRRRILRRIDQALACECRRTLWRLVSLQSEAIKALENAVRSQPGTASLAAAKEILNRSTDIEQSGSGVAAHNSADVPATVAARHGPPRPVRLPRETKRRILTEFDGPPPEE